MYANGECVPCLEHSKCGVDTLLETIAVDKGYWRLSGLSTEPIKCSHGDNDATPCIGGSSPGAVGQGYCINGTRGPKCVVCTADKHSFDEVLGRCVECEDTADVWLRLWLVFIGICMLMGAIYMLFTRPPRHFARLVAECLARMSWLRVIGVVPMLKSPLPSVRTWNHPYHPILLSQC